MPAAEFRDRRFIAVRFVVRDVYATIEREREKLIHARASDRRAEFAVGRRASGTEQTITNPRV